MTVNDEILIFWPSNVRPWSSPWGKHLYVWLCCAWSEFWSF